MDCQSFSRGLLLLFVLFNVFSNLSATEVCSNTILPGSKGDQGEVGDEGDQGRQGKTGPPGHRGLTGEFGSKGGDGWMGKMGPAGERGDKGEQGTDGPSGLKGKTGVTCDCGRYRKVVGQMDINIKKLKNAVKFVKNVILGIKETEEKLYLIVKEARRYRDAQVNCKLRGGALAMPKGEGANALLAGYVSEAGLTRVFVGLRAREPGEGHAYADRSPLQNYTAWGPGEPRGANSSCVELASTGAWSQVGCDVTMYYACEFPKNRTAPATPP